MAMLKSISSHLSCSFYIQRYLEAGFTEGRTRVFGLGHGAVGIDDTVPVPEKARHRALARDFINLYSDCERDGWAYTMDETRRRCSNDTPWGGRKAVTYQHFIISPDPKDGVDLETLRSLSMEWAQEMFGRDGGEAAGRFGSYEVAIVYHDDNDRRIPHAHVVVNNTDLNTGRRLQISNAGNDVLADRLQDMAEEHGLASFDNSEPRRERRSRGSYLTRTERELLGKDRFSWKQDLRERIQVARRLSNDEPGFLARLEMLGVEATVKKGDYLFCHPGNERWKAYGYRLGRNYTKGDIAYMQEGAAGSRSAAAGLLAERVDRFIEGVGFETVAYMEGDTTIKEIANMLEVNDRYGIKCHADYDAQLRTLAVRIKRANDTANTNAGTYEKALGSVSKAKQTASALGLFEGIAAASSTPKENAANVSGAAKRGSTKGAKRKQAPRKPEKRIQPRRNRSKSQ